MEEASFKRVAHSLSQKVRNLLGIHCIGGISHLFCLSPTESKGWLICIKSHGQLQVAEVGESCLRGGLQFKLNSTGVQDRLVGMLKLNNSCTECDVSIFLG